MTEPLVAPDPYPVDLRLAHLPALVVGGGSVAARKVVGLQRAGALVTVVAPAAHPAIADDPDLRWHQRPYRRGEVASYRLAVAAADDPAVNAQVHHDGEAANVFVNSADDSDHCSFTLPAVARHGDLQVTVSTNGRSPALASWLRDELDRCLATGYVELLEVLSEIRSEVRRAHGTTDVGGWAAALDDGLLELVRSGRSEEATSRLRHHLGLSRTAMPDPGDTT
ncbi:MAG: bifunctional precorrin-2 dehydrogenase/sirohydrochlorin ferrochelatase [Acidimicrobiales bacterium]